MAETKVSVALCTYNGEMYLQEQLESILGQTRLPDELIICDDGSNDRTIEIVEDFIKLTPFVVRLFKGLEYPLGSTKNFERAINLCGGNIIVLSDQDDVWYPEKLATLETSIRNGAALVFSDADLVDEHLNSIGYTLFESLQLSNVEKKLLQKKNIIEILMRRNIVTGASIAFSRGYLPLIMPISKYWVHDGWIAFLLASVGKVDVINEPLFKYRQHGKNQIGAKKLTFKQKIHKVRNVGSSHYAELLNSFVDIRTRIIDSQSQRTQNYLIDLIDLIDKKIMHLSKRAKLSNKYSFPLFSLSYELLTGKYNKFSRGFISYLRDLTMMIINLCNRI